MRYAIVAIAAGGFAFSAQAGVVTITGIMDGTLSGGSPKAIELYVSGTQDFTGWALDRASNGASFGTTSSLDTLGTVTDSFVYLVGSAGGGIADFVSTFGSSGDFANTFLIGVVSGNGNDAFRLLDDSASIIDQVYESNSTDVYEDSYMYRNDNTGPEGATWTPSNWDIPGNDVLDGLSPGQIGATVPFGTWVPTPGTLALVGLGGVVGLRRRR